MRIFREKGISTVNGPENNLQQVFSEFQAESPFLKAERIGSGHINDSFLIKTSGSESYFLQRINHAIFKDIPGLMSNILKVTRHIEEKITSGDPLAQSFSVVRLIPATNNSWFHVDPGGNYWRLYNNLEGTISYDIVENTRLAFEGGRAFGLFQYLTSDIPVGGLIETIPDFHNIEKRLDSFRQTIVRDPEERASRIQKEIEFVEERAEEMTTILRLGKQGLIPLRVTHNDTKFNNILFDKAGKAICIVDLDTVMPGYVLYDFGDAIRTGASTGAEDEKDLRKVSLSLELFEAYSRGYLEIARNFLNEIEIANLPFSAKFMTYIIGMRFLTDYLGGDHYYRILHKDHNLQRAHAQFKLLLSMEENYDKMTEIINEIIRQ
jgi:Ser/Thr protein kinase RdoA (MazF antagonist)